MRFFADHCVPHSVNVALAEDGHEVVRLREELPTDAAEELGTTQARISELMNGKIQTFSIDTLINMLDRAGLEVERERTSEECLTIGCCCTPNSGGPPSLNIQRLSPTKRSCFHVLLLRSRVDARRLLLFQSSTPPTVHS